MINCELTKEEYIDLIYSTLVDVDFCAADNITPETLMFFWDLQSCWSACDIELQYLLTRREAVKLLMGCNVYQVDKSESVSESSSTSSSESCSDGWNQRQSTKHSANWSDSLGVARSDSSGTSDGSTTASTVSFTESHALNSGQSDTIGYGRSYTDSLNDSFSYSDSLSHGESLSTKEAGTFGIGTFSTSEDYVFNHSQTDGFGFSVGIAGAGRTATEGEEHTYARSDDFDTDEQSRFGHSLSTVRSGGAGQTIGTSETANFTQAISDAFTQSTGVTDGATRGSSSGSTQSHSEGLSQSSAETRSKASTSDQSTDQSHSENTASSKSNSVGGSSGYSIKYNQRFKHLTTMYDNLTLLIEYKQEQINNGFSVSYGDMMCQPLCDRGIVPEKLCQPHQRNTDRHTIGGRAGWDTQAVHVF